MVTEKINLNNPERFSKPYHIPREKLVKALNEAAEKLEKLAKEHGTQFPSYWTVNYKHSFSENNNNWITGMYAGCYWLMYELTGRKFFKETAEALTLTFRERFDKKIAVNDHDIGFLFSPSAVAQYKITGDEEAKKLALEAAEYFYDKSYAQKGKFIIRGWKSWKEKGIAASCRTMMDSMMNVPLLCWASETTGDKKYIQAAINHTKTTEKLLVRQDASTYHHYQFDTETEEPLYGLTVQGHSDNSCWSRGQGWGIYGFPLMYSYTKDEYLVKLTRDVTYFMLNHLPSDLIPAWDYDFVSANAIKDSSAGAVSICGMLEMAKHLPEDAEEKTVYESAAAQMLEALIDKCTGERGIDYDGLIYHVTAALPMNVGIDECAVYGDYFYLEALARYLKPNYKRHW